MKIEEAISRVNRTRRSSVEFYAALLEVASRASSGAPAAPPVEPLPPRAAVKSNNLPVPRTAFIGREHDVAKVKALLSDHGLVTLIGHGLRSIRSERRLRVRRTPQSPNSCPVLMRHGHRPFSSPQPLESGEFSKNRC